MGDTLSQTLALRNNILQLLQLLQLSQRTSRWNLFLKQERFVKLFFLSSCLAQTCKNMNMEAYGEAVWEVGPDDESSDEF